jgi:hypothetical protein
LGYARPGDLGRVIKCGVTTLHIPGLKRKRRRARNKDGDNRNKELRGCWTVVTVTSADIRNDQHRALMQNQEYKNALHNLPGTPIPKQLMAST